jgi:hypothetical protein
VFYKINLLLLLFTILFFSVPIEAWDNLEGLSVGVDGGLLYTPNAKKFSVNSYDFNPNKINLSAVNFITIGAYARYGLTDQFGFELGISHSYTSDVKINLYRYEIVYMFLPYRENRYYVKFGGVRNITKSSVFEQAGNFDYSNGLIYTIGMEMGYSKTPLNFSISYLNLKSDFYETEGWQKNHATYDLSGIMVKTSFIIHL